MIRIGEARDVAVIVGLVAGALFLFKKDGPVENVRNFVEEGVENWKRLLGLAFNPFNQDRRFIARRIAAGVEEVADRAVDAVTPSPGTIARITSKAARLIIRIF